MFASLAGEAASCRRPRFRPALEQPVACSPATRIEDLPPIPAYLFFFYFLFPPLCVGVLVLCALELPRKRYILTYLIHSTKGKRRKGKKKRPFLALPSHSPLLGSANCFHPARHQNRGVLTSLTTPFERTTSIDQPALLSLSHIHSTFPFRRIYIFADVSSPFPPHQRKRSQPLPAIIARDNCVSRPITIHHPSPITTSYINHHLSSQRNFYYHLLLLLLLHLSSSFIIFIVFHLLFEYLKGIPF